MRLNDYNISPIEAADWIVDLRARGRDDMAMDVRNAIKAKLGGNEPRTEFLIMQAMKKARENTCQ